jgi:hypothetical protein
MNMNYRRIVPSVAEGNRRHAAWSDAPTIAERFPRAGRFAVELRFRDPSGAAQPSPIRQLYEPSMRAHFELRCPLRQCEGGGFDLQSAVIAMLSNDRLPRSGVICCEGARQSASTCCGLEVTYTISASRPL